MKRTTMELGQQPLHLLMLAHNLENRDVVAKAGQGVTFKVMKKARSGRRLTMRMQLKVLAAVNNCLPSPVVRSELFNYK